MGIDELLLKGVDEFNSGYFYECHDTLEELWNGENDLKDKIFYQGLIHTAVGFYHLTGGNLKGALSQLTKAVNKLENYPPVYKGIETEKLLTELKLWLDKIKHALDGKSVDLDFEKIPKIKFTEENENR